MNRLEYELRKRTVVAGTRRYVESLRDDSGDTSIRSMIESDKRAKAAGYGAPDDVGPPLEALGLTSDRELETYQRRNVGGLPNVAGAMGALARGEYRTALDDMDGIGALHETWRQEGLDAAMESHRVWFEGHCRVMRAKALAGMRQGAEALDELEIAEALARKLAELPIEHHTATHLGSATREEIAEAWEMLDEPEREAAILEPLPTMEEHRRLVQRVVGMARQAAQEGVPVEPERLEMPEIPDDRPPDGHTTRYWAATLESLVRRGGEPAPAERELADGVLEQVKKQRWCADTAENERARAVAHEVLGSTARARDGWQRVCLSLWAVCEPTHSPLWDRAWSHVERLGGKHWD